MNTYLIKAKVEKIRQCQQDFLEEYGETIHPFTRKIFFYFHVINGIKYIHKESLLFVYTNADTYCTDPDPSACNMTKEHEPIDVIGFLERYNGALLPNKVGDNSKFLEYKYEDGESVTNITKDEFFDIKKQYEIIEYTPFYNSMAYNLVRCASGIKLIDLKHFEPKDNKPFFVYMHNEDINLNKMYIEKGTELELIYSHLSIDYPIDKVDIIEYDER